MSGIILAPEADTRTFRGPLLLLALFSMALTGAFAGGKTEEVVEPPRNGEWAVVVCTFDVSTLPPYRQGLGLLAARSMVDSFNRIEHRSRDTREYGYYEGSAWSSLRSDAGKKLLAKWDERDQLLFRGEAAWRYRIRLAAVEEEIKTLQEELQAVEGKAPVVEAEPVLVVTTDNKNGIFLPPPKAGEEHQFCVSQKADAFITGALSEYYGRIYLIVRMYTVYTRSFQYEDSTIFSVDDITLGMEDLTGRLNAVLAGTTAAALAVTSEPDDAFILVGNTLAGRGSTGVVEHSPGTVQVEVFAENHEAVSLPVDLSAGELTELQITLPPLEHSAVQVEVPASPGSSVYQGSLFAGTAPLSLSLPRNQYGYVTIETPDEKTESLVFSNDWDSPLVFKNPERPRPSEEKPLETARRGYYGSWGRLWIAGSAALLISGLFTGYEASHNNRGTPSQLIYDRGNTMGYIRLGAFVATGVVAVDWIFRFIRYVYTANKDSARRAQ